MSEFVLRCFVVLAALLTSKWAGTQKQSTQLIGHMYRLTTSRPEWADATGDLIVNAFSYALALEIRRTFKDEIHAVITDILWQAQRSPDAPPLSEIASDPEAWIMKHESNMAVGPIDALKVSLGTGPERQLSMVRLLQRAAWVFRQIIYGIPVSLALLTIQVVWLIDALPFGNQDLPASKQCICILNSEKFHFYLRKMCTVFENMTKSVPAPGYPQDARKKLRADVEEWCKRRDKSPPDDSWFQSLDRIQERSYAALWLLIRDRAKGQLDPSKQFVGVRKVLRNIGGVRLYSIIAGASDDPQTPWLDEAEEFRAIVQVGADDAKPFSEDRAGTFEDMVSPVFVRVITKLLADKYRCRPMYSSVLSKGKRHSSITARLLSSNRRPKHLSVAWNCSVAWMILTQMIAPRGAARLSPLLQTLH